MEQCPLDETKVGMLENTKLLIINTIINIKKFITL